MFEPDPGTPSESAAADLANGSRGPLTGDVRRSEVCGPNAIAACSGRESGSSGKGRGRPEGEPDVKGEPNVEGEPDVDVELDDPAGLDGPIAPVELPVGVNGDAFPAFGRVGVTIGRGNTKLRFMTNAGGDSGGGAGVGWAGGSPSVRGLESGDSRGLHRGESPELHRGESPGLDRGEERELDGGQERGHDRGGEEEFEGDWGKPGRRADPPGDHIDAERTDPPGERGDAPGNGGSFSAVGLRDVSAPNGVGRRPRPPMNNSVRSSSTPGKSPLTGERERVPFRWLLGGDRGVSAGGRPARQVTVASGSEAGRQTMVASAA